ncbi:hypothetical protein C8J57DRAFT_1588176 [Mycena rebaudengoi]|nr:hypothetical protein C8J57DRAFT_1588176 [Mycena rebaudengoi]
MSLNECEQAASNLYIFTLITLFPEKNGYGEKSCPPDKELREALLRYAAQDLAADVRIANLKSDLNYSIRHTKLKQLHKKFHIPSNRKPPPVEVARQAVIDKVQMDTLQNNGPNYFKTVLQQEGIMIPRDTVRKIMLEHFPLGFDNRFPGKKKSAIPRVGLNSNGPFHEVSSDGHEKLGKQALDMVEPQLRLDICNLDFIETTGAIPIQMTTDKGSEIGWQYAIQDALRHAFAPDIDPEIYPICRIIKSVHNTIIEAFWRWFKEKKGLNLKAVILIGKVERIFSPNVEFHLQLFYWIFVPLLQAQLEEFRIWWNHHRVRSQKEKNMPSGHVPYDALDHPQNYGGMDCRIPVPQAAVDDLRQMVTEDVGPRDAHLSWYSAEFHVLADQVYAEIGRPTLSVDTAWDVFQTMLEPMANLIEA